MGKPTQAQQRTPETPVQIQPWLVKGQRVCPMLWSHAGSLLPQHGFQLAGVCIRNSAFPVPPWGLVEEAGQEGAVALPFPVS